MDMKDQDLALTISNPRLLAAIYFGLLAIIATIIIDTILYALGVEQVVPTFKAIILAVIVAACFGALFGERIIYSPKHGKQTFLWAFLMVLVALPVYNLGFVYMLKEHHATMFTDVTLHHLLYLYLFVLLYSFILAGLWLAIIAGVAAIYLRTHLVYHLLRSLNVRRKSPEQQTIVHNKTPLYGEMNVSSNKVNNDDTA